MTGSAGVVRRWVFSAVAGLACLLLSSPGAFGQFRRVGYLDVDLFAATGGDDESADAAVSAVSLNIVAAKRISYSFSFLAEIVALAERELTSDSTPGELDLVLERAHIRFDRLEAATVAVGRFHTPLSYWAEAYNHGSWLYPSVDFPLMAELDGRFLPGHLSGVLFQGNLWAEGWNLNYYVGAGDAREELSTRDSAGRLESEGATLVAIYVEPSRVFGLRAGLAAYADTVTVPGKNLEVDEEIVSGHLFWRRGRNEFSAEVARVRHTDSQTGQTLDNLGYYAQVTYLLPYFSRRLTLYNRLEELDIEDLDPVISIPSERQVIVGVRFDFEELLALKAELRQISVAGVDELYGLWASASYTF